MDAVRVVCAHDCPDMCSLLAHVENDRVVRIEGDPDQPYTAGFACAKVNRDAELVHSPERMTTPLRRTGPKGSGRFAPITWDEALDEITARWKAIIAESGPLALLGYAYSAHQGQMNRHIVNGLFHALGASRLQAGTVCDTCCETAWDLTLGPVGGADPESVVESDLVDRLGLRPDGGERPFLGKARGRCGRSRRQARRDRSAAQPHGGGRRLAPADPHRHRRGAGARHRAHPGARRARRPRLSRRPHARLRPVGARRHPALCAGPRRRHHRPRGRPTSKSSPPCTARPNAPSSASARA